MLIRLKLSLIQGAVGSLPNRILDIFWKLVNGFCCWPYNFVSSILIHLMSLLVCTLCAIEPHVYVSTYKLLTLKANLKYQVIEDRPRTLYYSFLRKILRPGWLGQVIVQLFVWWCYIWYSTNHGCTQNIIMLVLVAQPQYQYTFIGEQDICLLGSDLRSQ